MIRCHELLEEYSDFRDRRVSAERSRQIESHLEACPDCAAYHRILVRGVDELRALPGCEPSADFLPRLQNRIHELEMRAALFRETHASEASVAVVALLAAMIAGAAWLPALRPRPAIVELPPVAAAAPPAVWDGPNAFTVYTVGRAPVTSLANLSNRPLASSLRYDRPLTTVTLPQPSPRFAATPLITVGR